MKCNLIPPERRPAYGLSATVWTGMSVVCMAIAVAALAASLFLQYVATEEKNYYMSVSLPIQQRIREQNNVEKQLRQRREAIAKREKETTHWAPILVALASTKPAAVEVASLSMQQGRLRIIGACAEQQHLKNWEDVLRQESYIKSVQRGYKKLGNADISSFHLELELGNREGTVE